MKTKHWLILIFAITLTARLILAFTVPNLTYESYFHIKQVEHITETGIPLYYDNLSYGGRELLFLPFFHYFMAFFNLLLPIKLVAVIIPNILLATLTIIVYLITKKISNNRTASLISACIAGFLPIIFNTNSFTPETIFLPLTFLIIYAFMNFKERKYLHMFIILFLLLAITNFATLLLVIGFIIYLLLSIVEGKRISRAELELIIFSVFFFIWVQFLFLKNTFLAEGLAFIWQNIPSRIIQQYFPTVSILEVLVLVSIIPFLAGIFVVYRSLFQLKNQKAFLLISLAISTTILTWLRLIQFHLSLAFFGIILAILFASFYKEVTEFLKRTKAAYLQKFLPQTVLILLLLTMVPPAISTSLQQPVPSTEEINAFIWLSENTPENSSVLASLEEGHLITYYGKRKNLMDDQFDLIPNIEVRFNDLNNLLTTPFQTQAISLFNKYAIQYVVITPYMKKRHDIARLKYHSDECFERVYQEDETKIYRIKCILDKSK